MMRYLAIVLLVVATLPHPAFAAHSEMYNALYNATVQYVRREHPGKGKQMFTPVVSCIQLIGDEKSALINFAAGPKNDPVSTSLVLVQPQHLRSAMRASLMSALSEAPHFGSWAAVYATTSAPQPSVHGALSVRAFTFLTPVTRRCIN